MFKYLLLEKKITLKNIVKNKHLNSGALIIIEIGVLIILNYYLKINFYENVKGDEIALNYHTAILTINKYVEKPSEIIKLIENFYNFTRGLEVYIGLIAIVSAIYIYCIGFTDTFKKNILIFLMGEEKILLILVSILLFYFFNIPSIYFISLTIILFYFLYKAIELIFLIMNHKKLEEVFSTEIVPKFKKLESGNGLNNLYQEIQVNLYQAIVDRNLIRVEELLTFLKEFLVFQENENNNRERIEYPEEKLIPFFYKCYKHLIEVPDINVLLALSNISIYLGDFYLERKDYKKAQSCYSLIELNYEYYIKNYKEDIFLNIGSSLFSSLGSKNSDILEEVICHESALLKLIHKIIQIEDYKNLREFLVFYNLDILREGINKKIKIYSYIIIICFLKEKQSIKYKESKERLELLQELSNDIICFVDRDILQEIYELQKKEKLEEKMGIHYLKFPRFDFQGISGYTSSRNEIVEEILILLNKLRGNLSEDFILKNYKELRVISESMGLSKITLRLNDLKNEIGLLEAKEISNENAIVRETFYKEINENDLLLMSKLKLKLNFKIEKDYLPKELWNTNKRGYKKAIRSKAIYNFNPVQLINNLSEELFLDQLIKNLKGTKNIENLKEWILLLTFEDYNMLDKKLFFREGVQDWNKKLNIIQINKIYLKKSIMIKKDAIDSVVYLLPENIENLKYTYIDIYSFEKDKQLNYIKEGNTIEEKELISKGYSWIEIYQVMKIILNNDEIYEIQNLDEISKETIENLNKI